MTNNIPLKNQKNTIKEKNAKKRKKYEENIFRSTVLSNYNETIFS